MALYATVVQTLGVLSFVAVFLAAALVVLLLTEGGRRWLRGSLSPHPRHPIGWAWGVASLATAGSLYFSEVVGFVPCLLCWYQRIAMYPLVLVLGVGLLRGDTGVWRYGLPLSVVGLVISSYHVALQFRPSLELIPCGTGVSCSGRYVTVFGFVSIPVMAGAAFLLITTLLAVVGVIGARGGASAT
jgi:disulfide bond formation protein DsbB